MEREDRPPRRHREHGQRTAIRLALKHDILVGSRSIEKAGRIARNLNNVARGFYLGEMEGSIMGVMNADAVSGSEVVIVTLPPQVFDPGPPGPLRLSHP